MKKLFNWSLVLGACVAAFYLTGLIVPRNQTLGSRTNFATPTEDVFAYVSDVATWPQWHPDVSRVEPLEKRKDYPLWRVTDKTGQTYELEVVQSDQPRAFVVTFERDGTRYTLHFDLSGFGEGSRVRISQTVDTRDTWQRAQHFLLPNRDVSALSLLTALANHLGEKTKIEEK